MTPSELARAAGFKTVAELADAIGVKPPSLYQWREVPAKRAVQIEQLSEGRLQRHVMRPDLWPAPEGGAA